jgi:hypothetical protein
MWDEYARMEYDYAARLQRKRALERLIGAGKPSTEAE